MGLGFEGKRIYFMFSIDYNDVCMWGGGYSNIVEGDHGKQFYFENKNNENRTYMVN
jgi:hypothetical protein